MSQQTIALGRCSWNAATGYVALYAKEDLATMGVGFGPSNPMVNDLP